MPATTRPHDNIRTFNFKVDFGSKLSGMVREVSIAAIESEVIEGYDSDGGTEFGAHPGKAKYGRITIKRPMTVDKSAWDWRKMIEDGNLDGARTMGTITLMNYQGKPVVDIILENAWPTKVSGPSGNANANELVMEEIELAYDDLYRQYK